jgi:RND family efflux transporter MFP subunit
MMSIIKQSNYLKTSASAGLMLLIAVFFSACGKKETPVSASDAKSDSVVRVAAAQSVVREVPRYIAATGNLVADEQSDIASLVSGKVTATPVSAGAFVNQGDVIAQLDARDAELRLKQAQGSREIAAAAVRQAKARLGLGEGGSFDPQNVPEVLAASQNYQAALAQVKNAEAQVENAEVQARLAEDTARRYGNLYRSGDASLVLYNQHKTQAEAAQTQVRAARESVNSLKAQANAARRQYEAALNNAKQSGQGIDSAEAQLRNAETQIAIEQKAINDATIRAPFSGFISERTVAVGEYITPQSKIAVIVRTNPIKVNLQVPETEAANIGVGKGVSLSVAAYPDRKFAGTVTAVNPSLEAASRAIMVEAEIENGENLLRPNMFAQARILQPGGEQAVFVPKSAVIIDKNTNSSRVFTIADGVARLVVVQLGEEENDMVRVTSGLDGSEQVAVSNLNELFDGVNVEIVAG